jgi:hypothetical protein
MLSRILTFFVAVLLSTQVLCARGDTFTYTFLAGSAGQLSFGSPTLLTTDTTLPASSVVTDIANLASFEINPTVNECNGNTGMGVSCAGIVFSNNDGFFIFFGAPLTTTGVFGSDDETLTIAETAGPSAVPEPSNVTMIGIGMTVVVLVCALRRRRMATRSHSHTPGLPFGA